jgi:predicted dehydrogenase
VKRYAIVGLSNRGINMYVRMLVERFGDVAAIVALLDKDPLRFKICREAEPRVSGVPTYSDEEFDRMVDETRPDAIIVTGADHVHAHYAIAGLRRGIDVIIEKPMTNRSEQARRIVEAEAASRGRVIVTFNYRYNAVHRRIKEIVLEGRLGRVTQVNLNWYLDTNHGASFFKRWNRVREHSGGLSITKACHHFDLLNWWIGDDPVEVFANGALNYFGADGPMNPEKADGRHCSTCAVRSKCAYEMRWDDADRLGNLARLHDSYAGYVPDACIFDSEIDIEDTYAAVIRYSQGALVSYSCNWSLPYEGYRLAINGTLGRLESMEYHTPHRVPWDIPDRQSIDFFPLFGGSKETINVLHTEGGHGGGDPLIMDEIVLGPDPDRPYGTLAGSRAGLMSVAVGEAVWRSAKEGRPFRIAELTGQCPDARRFNREGREEREGRPTDTMRSETEQT